MLNIRNVAENMKLNCYVINNRPFLKILRIIAIILVVKVIGRAGWGGGGAAGVVVLGASTKWKWNPYILLRHSLL
jgi:hypothetical protein